MQQNQPSIASDLLEGADEVARFVFGSPQKRRRVYDLAARSEIPLFRVGRVLCGRRSTLRAWISAKEAASASKPGVD